MMSWRHMTADDLDAAHAISEIIHPGYPEDRAVFADRLALYPTGCFVLADGNSIAGYALSHPFTKDAAPALNTHPLTLPKLCDTYYIHDIAILPQARQGGAGAAIVTRLRQQAALAGFAGLALIAVNNSAPFWQRQGFAGQDVPHLREKLASYGAGCVYMRCAL